MTDYYKQWLSAKHKWRTQAGDSLKPPEPIAKELRKSTMDLLRLVAKGEKQLPGDVAFELAEAMGALEAGQDESFLLPGSIRLTKRKQPLKHPFVKGLRLDAVRYLDAVAKKRIHDNQPKRTVALAYGVESRTARRWHKKYPEVEGYGAVSVITAVMQASGKQYKKQMKRRKQKT
jgi:hypothetical protein